MKRDSNELKQVLHRFRIAMLVTRSTEGDLRARPMVLADVSDDGCLWFISSSESGKLGEVLADPHALAICQSPTRHVAVSGHVEVVSDPERLRSLWDERWEVFIPEHERDGERVLLRLQADHAEYWHVSARSAARFAVDAVKALVRGETPHGRPDRYGHVQL